MEELNHAVRVSILDDQSLVRESLAYVLSGAGIEVVGQHAEARQFLANLDSDQPTVALVDLTLRSGEGLSVLEEGHQFHPQVRFLAMSDSVDASLMERCFQAGAAGYLDTSSARAQSLVDAVQAVARGDHVLPAPFVESLLRARVPESPESARLRTLSVRERQVLAYLAGGVDNLKIATFLKVSERTVKAHVSSLYRKLGQENRTQLALLARQLGVRPPQDV